MPDYEIPAGLGHEPGVLRGVARRGLDELRQRDLAAYSLRPNFWAPERVLQRIRDCAGAPVLDDEAVEAEANAVLIASGLRRRALGSKRSVARAEGRIRKALGDKVLDVVGYRHCLIVDTVRGAPDGQAVCRSYIGWSERVGNFNAIGSRTVAVTKHAVERALLRLTDDGRPLTAKRMAWLAVIAAYRVDCAIAGGVPVPDRPFLVPLKESVALFDPNQRLITTVLAVRDLGGRKGDWYKRISANADAARAGEIDEEAAWAAESSLWFESAEILASAREAA